MPSSHVVLRVRGFAAGVPERRTQQQQQEEQQGANKDRRRVIPILTLHAAGHNHLTCLGALERAVVQDMDLRDEVVFYHVDTPGHEEGGEGIE